MPCLPRPTDVPGTVDIKDPELVDEKCVKHLLMAYPKLSFFQFDNKCAFIGAPGSGKSAATIDFVRKNWGEYAKVKVAVFTPWDVAIWTQYAIECNTKTGYNNVEIQCYFPNFDWVSWAVGAHEHEALARCDALDTGGHHCSGEIFLGRSS